MNTQAKEKFYARLKTSVIHARQAEIDKDTAALALACLDLTNLDERENVQTVKDLCTRAKSLPGHHTAAVCVYPLFIEAARTSLINTAVRVATVINFPYGDQTNDGEAATPENTAEAVYAAITDGAGEIDIVLDYRGFQDMEEDRARALLRACREACGDNALMKVILETSSFRFEQDIVDAGLLAIDCGADMLKTSTGKHPQGGATLETAAAMMHTAALCKHERPVGIKISGGLKSAKNCAEYMALAKDYMGEDFVRPDRFRFGASGIYADLSAVIRGVKPPSASSRPQPAY